MHINLAEWNVNTILGGLLAVTRKRIDGRENPEPSERNLFAYL